MQVTGWRLLPCSRQHIQNSRIRLQRPAKSIIARTMALTHGTKLGPYEIQSPLGAGGMGEVYRARDTRLDRTVAVKVLPSHLAQNAEARERFEREARAISALN